ncbi:MAG: PQQ-dependent sugar dehydrogenase [Phycisphaeraceae bacterium]|nr:PQQ-dependent sugar dehydrogenase [Phycisphaeraceae bacterium]MCW5763717.1 PQQ-dependent sugar dehydrogenase [Phycisphaeraceae bacterium]
MRIAALALSLSIVGAPALADITPLTTVLVADGLVRPIGVFHAPGDTTRIFVIEKQGIVRIIENGALLATPFMNIDPIVGGGTTTSSEQGLLGMAFHPDYANNGKFYVNYTNNSGHTTIAEYLVSADPNIANLLSARILRVINQPFSNHNGGWMEFGPNDGYLYIAMGDGGSANDPGNRAQTITNQPLGKILRIDVDGNNAPGGQYGIPASNPFVGITGDDDIWAYGVRNPWRNAFDRANGDLYLADVGQNAWEEINYQPGTSVGGENYGWRCYEGNNAFNTTGCQPAATMVFPVHVYGRGSGCSVTGGRVYRGCRMPENHGTYFFADYCSNIIWSFRMVNGVRTQFAVRTAELAPGGGLSITSITSFGEDANGEIYICDQNGGEIFKIVPAGATVADWNGDGNIDFFDVSGFLAEFSGQTARADLNGDGEWNFFDVQFFLTVFSTACPAS